MKQTRRSLIIGASSAIGFGAVGTVSGQNLSEQPDISVTDVESPEGGSVILEITEFIDDEEVTTEEIIAEDGVLEYPMSNLEVTNQSEWGLALEMTDGDNGNSPEIEFPVELEFPYGGSIVVGPQFSVDGDESQNIERGEDISDEVDISVRQ